MLSSRKLLLFCKLLLVIHEVIRLHVASIPAHPRQTVRRFGLRRLGVSRVRVLVRNVHNFVVLRPPRQRSL